jgi:putative SOS response-associated peptidase YedK
MCYSAQIQADYRKYEREYGAQIDIAEFARLYWERDQGAARKTPKALDDAFLSPRSAEEQEIAERVRAWKSEQATKLQQELFAQSRRLADAERKLATKVTKAATESQRIATNKIGQLKARLADLNRTEAKDRDSRIFPGLYAPVMVMENGQRIIRPMRYQCRPCGKPAFYDSKYPGTYNARRDNLEGFWKGQFGVSHGLMIVNAFFENVARHDAEGRPLREGEAEENVVLEFRPEPRHDMLVACLWSRWSGTGEPDLLSFAAITDEPPPEVAAAGHDRCIVPIKPEHIDAWLSPSGRLDDLYAILDDRDRPYYEHRIAA